MNFEGNREAGKEFNSVELIRINELAKVLLQFVSDLMTKDVAF